MIDARTILKEVNLIIIIAEITIIAITKSLKDDC
jgi:hypothetical protein